MNDNIVLEKIRETINGIVNAGLLKRPDGVHLTWVGGEFVKRINVPFEQYINLMVLKDDLNVPATQRKMAPFLKAYCSDFIDLQEFPNGAVIVRKRQISSPTEIIPEDGTDHSFSRRFKKGVWVAFIRPLANEKSRYIDPSWNSFKDTIEEISDPSWKKIEARYIVPTPPDHPINGPLVQQRISEWAKDTNMSIEELLNHEPIYQKPLKGSINDLLNVIASLPPEIADRWLIPASVFNHLHTN